MSYVNDRKQDDEDERQLKQQRQSSSATTTNAHNEDDDKRFVNGIPLLDDRAVSVIEKRYLLRGDDGRAIETISEMFSRVARHVAAANTKPGPDGDSQRGYWGSIYEKLMTDLKFLPNTPTFTGAGTRLGQLAACFVLPIDDDIGRDSANGIFSTLRNAALIQQSGGGVGFSFTRLRPKGDLIASVGGISSGPVSFMKAFDACFGTIAQGGTRRGANMGVLRVDHPDIMEFINCKRKEGELSNFNISVGITDDFMRAVLCDDRQFSLINPKNGQVTARIPARAIMNEIAKAAHANGEPGALFLDTINAANPLPGLYTIESTNPCGEQALGPFENCCLGSINLARHVKFNWGNLPLFGSVDWDSLAETVQYGVRFLDSVVTVNCYVPAVPELREAAWKCRRIGLGFTALADLFYMIGIRYGSKDSISVAGQISEYIQYWAMRASVDLARQFGPFPAIRGYSIFDPQKYKPVLGVAGVTVTAHCSPSFNHVDIGMPRLDWPALHADIMKYGIRNAAVTTVAPTGTISTIAGVEGYGIEPVFSLAYTRLIIDRFTGEPCSHKVVSPLFRRALVLSDIDPDSEEVMEWVKTAASVVNNNVSAFSNLSSSSPSSSSQPPPQYKMPEDISRVFVVSSNVPAVDQVLLQGVVQDWFSNSISKTINFPNSATCDDFMTTMIFAWNRRCRGVTMYRVGSRKYEILSSEPRQSLPP